MEYQHISAGELAPVFWETLPGDTVQASIQRYTDDLYWDGTDWVVLETMLPCTEYKPGVYRFITPAVLDGHYLVSFQSGLGARKYTHLFAGNYIFTSTLELCLVYGIIVDGYNRPVKHALMQIRPIPAAAVDNTWVSTVPSEEFTDEFGNISIELIRNREYLITIPSLVYNKRVLIPDVSSVRFEDL